MEISSNTTLDRSKTYGRIIIRSSDIIIDGNGASIVGTNTGDPKTFNGIGVEAQGVSNVVLKNLNVRGFETGLHIEYGNGWSIQNCNLSGNFDDPSFGWGQLSRRGGIVMIGVTDSKILNCRSNKNWVGCALERSNGNILQGNDFSRCSEACLEFWQASRNTIENNKLDYGNRARPDEVHARDSCCVLIESGSDDNTFTDNSCTYGGDGIFLRCLNGWVSTRNRFLRNDCSHAHNHGVECWCPGNIFESNKANHCSYGFWMGGSDRTIMLTNEASFNGDRKGNHFSPHLPDRGHAGIVFMRGSGTHIVLRGNRCIGNNGAGIALIGDQTSKGAKWKAHHWVIDNNVLNQNRWGIFAQYADWIDLGNNKIENNTVADFQKDAGVTNVIEHPADPTVKAAPVVIVHGPSVVKVGQRVVFDASQSNDPNSRPLQFRWRLGKVAIDAGDRVEHTFATAGFYRVGVTASNGTLSNLASCDVFAVTDGPELGTEQSAARWDWVDPNSRVRFNDDREIKILGRTSLRAAVSPYGGGRVELQYTMTEREALDSKSKSHLEFWLRNLNPHIPCWQGENPIVTLYGPDDSSCRFRPKVEIINWTDHPECRDGWLLVRIPLHGDSTWSVEGTLPGTVNKVALSFDSWGAKPFQIWLDGMRFE